MRGSSHIVMNFSTALGVGGTLAAAHYANTGFFHNAADGILGFLFRPDFNVVSEGFSIAIMAVFGTFLYMLGSVLPDIDHPHSGIGKVAHIPVKHRTWTHAIYGALLFVLVGLFWRMCLWLGLGYFGHLIADSLSESGVDWFYPKKNKHHFLKLYHTSQPSEYIVVGVWVTINIVVFAIMMYILISHLRNGGSAPVETTADPFNNFMNSIP